jgi:hypothetical protein
MKKSSTFEKAFSEMKMSFLHCPEADILGSTFMPSLKVYEVKKRNRQVV